jgi:hypothetical protein
VDDLEYDLLRLSRDRAIRVQAIGCVSRCPERLRRNSRAPAPAPPARAGYVDFPDSRISKTEEGSYLAVGPVDLTAEGRAALARDRRLGERPPRSHDRLWRYE